MAENTTEDLLEQIRLGMEYLGVSQAAMASAIGVSTRTVGNYLNGVTACGENLRKMEEFLRSQEFYRGYCFQRKDVFSRLFAKIWNRLKNTRSTRELCDKLGLTPSEVNHIRENTKTLDVRRQYEVLTGFYEMCLDYTGVYLPDFEKTGEELYHMLGMDFPSSIILKYADLLNEILSNLDFEISERALAEETGISPEVIKSLQNRNGYPLNVWVKCDILDAIRRFCKENPSENAEDVCRRLDRLLLYYDGKNGTPPEMQEYFDQIRSEIIADFKKYPAQLQEIILSHRRIFFDNSLYDDFSHTRFWDYIHAYSIPEELGLDEDYCCVSEFDYYYAILRLFRRLGQEGQREILELLQKDFEMPFPSWETGGQSSYFELATQCFELALMTGKGDLLSQSRQKTFQTNARKTGMTSIDAGLWEYYHSRQVECKLGFCQREWCLWAMLNMAVRRGKDLNPMIYRMLDALS